MPREHDRRFADFSVGDSVAFARRFGGADFAAFAELSGDRNPLHHDRAYAAASRFGEPIVPLHLAAAPLSAVAGMMLPGHRSLYLTSRVKALAPVPYDRDITYSARVMEKSAARSTLGLRAIAFDGAEVLLTAEMVVQVRDDVPDELAPALEIPPIERTTRRSVLISGATGAIGAATAVALADAGWDLVLLHRGRRDAAMQVKEACAAAGAKVALLSADLADPRSLGRLCARLAKRESVTALVHAASPGIGAGLDDLMAVNYKALARLGEALLPGMLRRQEGTVLLLGSSALQHNPRGWEDYIAAKAAASQFVTALNQRYGDYGISGCVLAPGYVDTDFSRDHRPAGAPALLPEQVAEAITTSLQAGGSGAASYLWLEQGGSRQGAYGFHERLERPSAETASPPPQAPAGGDGAAPTAATRANGLRDPESLIRAFLGAGPEADLSEAGVDQFPGWDSLRHLELLLHLERELGISYSSREMEGTTRFTDLCSLTVQKLARHALPGSPPVSDA